MGLSGSGSVERWELFEWSIEGPAGGNPFREVRLHGEFACGSRKVTVPGFYDGNGVYRIRFMPDREGTWSYETTSSCEALSGHKGRFECVAPRSPANRGPVGVRDELHFEYADGGAYLPFGTTCYAWIHQEEELREATLRTLAASPFNKLRMCVFPKNYSFNATDPERFPFPGNRADGFDFDRFDPEFFARLEKSIEELGRLGIEADLILFHPYDNGRWGFDEMTAEQDAFYLRYVLARLSAYRNVWWSLANEYDLMDRKSEGDWDRLFRIVQEEDPYGHPRSIHNWTRMYDPDSIRMYDHGKSWVTHCSVQHWDVTLVPHWHKQYRKPIVVDECGYEGNIPQRWGNLPAEEMAHRVWDGTFRGGFVGHGETYVHPADELWWAKGGRLHGESPARIAFLRKLLEEAPACLKPVASIPDVPAIGVEYSYYLLYFGIHRPKYREFELPEGLTFRFELIDTQAMTIETIAPSLAGKCRVELPGRPYLALRVRANE